VGELNEKLVKVGKFKDEYEMFLVIEGKLQIVLDHKTIEINAGEFVIIPKKINHKPKAIGEVKILLFEPKITINTGKKENKFTIKKFDKI